MPFSNRELAAMFTLTHHTAFVDFESGRGQSKAVFDTEQMQIKKSLP